MTYCKDFEVKIRDILNLNKAWRCNTKYFIFVLPKLKKTIDFFMIGQISNFDDIWYTRLNCFYFFIRPLPKEFLNDEMSIKNKKKNDLKIVQLLLFCVTITSEREIAKIQTLYYLTCQPTFPVKVKWNVYFFLIIFFFCPVHLVYYVAGRNFYIQYFRKSFLVSYS